MKQPYVTFEPEEHIYTLHGDGSTRVIPSVTEIIEDNGLGFDFSRIPNLDLAWYGDRGTKVHLACDYLDKGILDWDSIDPKILGYIKSYELAKHEYNFEVLESEMLVFDGLLRFAGTLDRIVKFLPGPLAVNNMEPDIPAQIDIKSGMPHISHGYQTAAYNVCLGGNQYSRDIRRFCLYLKKDGSLAYLKPYLNLNDFIIFESAVNLTYARK